MYQGRSAEEAEEILYQFARTDPDVLWMFSPDWSELRFADDAYEELWGRSLDTLAENPTDFLDGIHPDDRQQVRDAMDSLSDGMSVELECRICPGDIDGVREVWMKGRPVFDDDGELVAIAGYVRDITERKRYERQVEEVTSFLSHDLQNQLQTASGAVELLRDECSSEYLDHIERALERMHEMTADVLALPDADPASIERTAVSLTTLAIECWNGIDHDDSELVVEDETTLRVDASLFRNVLENLFQNAVTHNKTAVSIRLGPLPDEKGIYIEDDGSGIAVEPREQVFEVGHSTGGSGLGLPLVREIVITHGGSIKVQASEAGGARFEISNIE